MISLFHRWRGANRRNKGLIDLSKKGVSVLDRYENELKEYKLLDLIKDAQEDFELSITGKTCRGNDYGFGGMKPEISARLYGLVRQVRPSVLVETGVCNGVSTAVILAAMEKNGKGMLHSIDLPEFTDTQYEKDTFWEGKKGAAVPKGKEPGWLIPDDFRHRWSLTIGSSRDKLPPLLDGLQAIDFFFHDSEHSIECMQFEYQAAWQYLKPGGLLVSDDICWNTVFEDFASEHARTVRQLGRNIAFIIK